MTTINYQLIGQRIAAQRKNKQITQEQLAEYLDVSTAFISKIERGKTQISLERLMQICHFLQLSSSVLLEGSDSSSACYMFPELSALIRECPPELLPLIKTIIEDILSYHKNNRILP